MYEPEMCLSYAIPYCCMVDVKNEGTLSRAPSVGIYGWSPGFRTYRSDYCWPESLHFSMDSAMFHQADDSAWSRSHPRASSSIMERDFMASI